MDSAEVLSAHRRADVQSAVSRVLACSRSDDVLIRKAAAGLAVVCVDVLRERHGGVNGRRVVLLVGTGHNGADALLAGVHLRSRAASVEAVLLGGRAYAPGLAALRAAHGMTISAASDDGKAKAFAALASRGLGRGWNRRRPRLGRAA